MDNVPLLLKRNMTSRQQRRLWHHVEAIDNFWATLAELEPGLLARLSAIAAERRWDVIFLTKRPETIGATVQVQSQHWLESKGFTLPSVYVVQGSRGRIAAALGLDIVVDDRPENCLDVVVDSNARAILVWREDEKQLRVAARPAQRDRSRDASPRIERTRQRVAPRFLPSSPFGFQASAAMRPGFHPNGARQAGLQR